MKLIHISDLHLGKKLNEISLYEDQIYVLKQVIETIQTTKADGLIIAGDIYQKSIPADETFKMFNNFIEEVAKLNVKVFIISGNHDSSQKLSYLSKFLRKNNIYISEVFNGKIETITLTDQYGELDIHLLPFIKPAMVRKLYPDEEITNYSDAVKVVLKNSNYDKKKRNIIISHQYITNAELSDSEELSLGGLDNIDYEIFNDFDYVALGHIHKAQRCGRDTLRYSGSILKYSLSEHNQKKSMTVVEIKEKSDILIESIPFKFIHDVRLVKGLFKDLMNFPYSEDFVGVTIIDEEVNPDSRLSLYTVFPNMIRFSIENSKTSVDNDLKLTDALERKNIVELFSDFYKMQNNNQELKKEHLNIINKIKNDMEDENE